MKVKMEASFGNHEGIIMNGHYYKKWAVQRRG